MTALSSTLDLDRLFRRGMPLAGINVYAHDGSMLMSMPSSLGGNSRGGLALQRHELHAALLEGLDESRIRVGVSIVQILDGLDHERVTLSDGTVHDCSLVVGADGIRSSVRRYVWPEATLRHSGETCWRLVVPHRLEDAELAGEVWGHGKRLGFIQISPREMYVYATLKVRREEPRTRRASSPRNGWPPTTRTSTASARASPGSYRAPPRWCTTTSRSWPAPPGAADG